MSYSNKSSETIKYSQEKRTKLYRLAAKAASSVISTKVDPTEELVRIATEAKLGSNEIDRVGQKLNVLLNEHHFRTSQQKDAEHALADPDDAKEKVKTAVIEKKIPVKGQMEQVASKCASDDFNRTPDEVIPVAIPDVHIEPSETQKLATAEVSFLKTGHDYRHELEKLQRVKQKLDTKIAHEKYDIEQAYQKIKGQLKQAYLSGCDNAFAELYVAGCLSFPEREPKIAEVLTRACMELVKEGAMDREGFLKFSSIPDEYRNTPQVVDSNRSILVLLDTTTREPKNGIARWTNQHEVVDDRIKYLVKAIKVLEGGYKKIRTGYEDIPNDPERKDHFEHQPFEILSEKATPVVRSL